MPQNLALPTAFVWENILFQSAEFGNMRVFKLGI